MVVGRYKQAKVYVRDFEEVRVVLLNHETIYAIPRRGAPNIIYISRVEKISLRDAVQSTTHAKVDSQHSDAKRHPKLWHRKNAKSRGQNDSNRGNQR